MNISRRQLLSHASLLSGSTLIFGCAPIQKIVEWKSPSSHINPMTNRRLDFPIHYDIPVPAPQSFYGPNPERAHALLWAQNQTAPSSWYEHPGPLVIGGGLSGLTAAYLLRDLNPLVLEADSRFGGNSQAQAWGEALYSIGAAYLVAPETGSDIHTLLAALKLLPEIKISKGSEAYALNGALRQNLWTDSTDDGRSAATRVKRLEAYIDALLQDEEPIRYPNIPTLDSRHRQYINSLDREPFLNHLERMCGGRIPSPLRIAIEQYCWSAFGGAAHEISAASGLNFYASESADIAVLAGGNACVTERLCEEIRAICGDGALRSHCIVVSVSPTESGVEVIYQDEQGVQCGVRAPRVVISCPKFVAKHIVQGLSESRLTAMRSLRYRAYLTANVLLSRKPSLDFYDLYLLKDRAGNPYKADASLDSIGATDVILGTWASAHPTGAVLTLYRTLPYDGGRATLLSPESFNGIRRSFETQVITEICPLFNLSSSDIVDMRIARFGHALPLAATGLIAAGIPDLLREPIEGKIFFAQQDNWALPAFEVAVAEGFSASSALRESLRARKVI